MRPFSLELAEASAGELVEVMEAAALELAGRAVPESGIACMEIAERLGRTLDVSESALAGLVGRVHSSGVHKAWALPSTAAWLADRLGMARGRANERVTLARQLPRIPVVAKMLASQELPLGYAHVITDCVQRLEDGEDLDAGVRILLELHAAGCPVRKIAQAGHRIKDLVAERLGKEPEDVKRDPQRSWLQKSRSGFGGSFWKGWFNAEDSAAIEEIIDPIAKPTMANDDRNLSQRTADALCSAVTGGNRGAGITVVVDLAAWTVKYGTGYPFGDHLTDQWRTADPGHRAPDASVSTDPRATTGMPASRPGAHFQDHPGTTGTRHGADARGQNGTGASSADARAKDVATTGADTAPGIDPGTQSGTGSSRTEARVQDRSATAGTHSDIGARAQSSNSTPTSTSGRKESLETRHQQGPGQAQAGRWVNPDAVRGRVPARLLNGSPVAAQDVLRMAVYAGISVLLVGLDGIPLYLGRAQRLGSPGQRRALEALYETCAVTTCQTPGHLCEIHHLNGGWKTGTPTDIDQLTLVCKWHNCWFEDHPEQILESRDERGRTVIDILPPQWASGRGFKNPRRPTRRMDNDISGYANPPVYNEQTARNLWLTPTERTQHTTAQANDHPPAHDQEGDGTTDTRGP